LQAHFRVTYAVEKLSESLPGKTYYGIEFMVWAINNGGDLPHEIYVHEAKRSGGALFHVPCVRQSELARPV